MEIKVLGEAVYPSPMKQFTHDTWRIPANIKRHPGHTPHTELLFEVAGPRPLLYFDPRQVRAGIVTCGGLCPGLNNVIRSLYFGLHYTYGVPEVWGFRFGYQGLDPQRGQPPMRLTPELVEDIHREGGTLLGTSRGPVDTGVAVDTLMRLGIQMLFTIGGDGTQRGANDLYQEAQRRGYALSVVGIPKTIDNDVAFVSRTFGYLTAVEESCRVIDGAHREAHSVLNGISLVKLMGRAAGFIAAGATVASQDVNFTLIPEVPFKLEGPGGFLAALKDRLTRRAHAVVVVAEGAGQDLLAMTGDGRDASGNAKLGDIGPYFCDRIEGYLRAEKFPYVLRYFDPSYLIRSRPAGAEDAILCDLLARNAVHAAMAGKTGLVVGMLHDAFIHIPIELLVAHHKRLNPDDVWWQSVLAATGQPVRFE